MLREALPDVAIVFVDMFLRADLPPAKRSGAGGKARVRGLELSAAAVPYALRHNPTKRLPPWLLDHFMSQDPAAGDSPRRNPAATNASASSCSAWLRLRSPRSRRQTSPSVASSPATAIAARITSSW